MKQLSLIFITLIFVSTKLMANDTLIIATYLDTNKKTFTMVEELVAEASKKMGIQLKLQNIPAARSQVLLAKGLIFGEISRIQPYENDVRNAIRIKYPVVTLPVFAFTTIDTLRLHSNGWKSLDSLRVVSVRGGVYEHYLENHSNVNLVNTHEAGFRFIQTKRADVFPIDILTAKPILEEIDPEKKLFRMITPAIDNAVTYAFISVKYAYLEDKFTAAIKEMVEEGSMNKKLMEMLQ